MKSETAELPGRVAAFVEEVVEAMGLDVEVTVEAQPDVLRVSIDGEGGEPLVRRKGEALDALQLLVNAVFRHDLPEDRRLVVDCLDFRRAKDRELRQITRFLVEKARSTGQPQEIGPLNSYARRIVHLAVSEFADMSSESQGDGAVKTVFISKR
jgi:spoIIIJ-associated protein